MAKLVFGILFICTLTSIGLTSCTEDNETSPEAKIAGSWTMKSAIGHYVVLGQSSKDTTHFTPSDFFKFNADGTLAIHEGTINKTGNWKIENNKLIISGTGYIDYPAGFDIQTLDDHDLKLYHAHTDAVGSMEQWLILKR